MWLWLVLIVVLLFGLVVFRGAPYVPSRRREIEQAFKSLYPLSAKDTLVDIGSGDGIVLRVAARYGAKAIGYELNPILVGISRLLSRNDKDVKTYFADFWRITLPPTVTIVYTFGESRDIVKMAQKVADEANRLNKTLYFMSYAFAVPGQTPSKTEGAYFLYRYSPLQIKKP